ncbi:hypothetical protein BJ508DRAFT_336711 [Ascobolus immersus RN42]|uniref:Uncharacterized protein n=1 Tax=Ascobolus immersus RN42 TaxID=1160509 RepID=A0A3N4H7M9_ASCIM|nr:hypothetical protein BJ508DRAFT_336711 [Ascobolus immersus RN42]
MNNQTQSIRSPSPASAQVPGQSASSSNPPVDPQLTQASTQNSASPSPRSDNQRIAPVAPVGSPVREGSTTAKTLGKGLGKATESNEDVDDFNIKYEGIEISWAKLSSIIKKDLIDTGKVEPENIFKPFGYHGDKEKPIFYKSSQIDPSIKHVHVEGSKPRRKRSKNPDASPISKRQTKKRNVRSNSMVSSEDDAAVTPTQNFEPPFTKTKEYIDSVAILPVDKRSCIRTVVAPYFSKGQLEDKDLSDVLDLVFAFGRAEHVKTLFDLGSAVKARGLRKEAKLSGQLDLALSIPSVGDNSKHLEKLGFEGTTRTALNIISKSIALAGEGAIFTVKERILALELLAAQKTLEAEESARRLVSGKGTGKVDACVMEQLVAGLVKAYPERDEKVLKNHLQYLLKKGRRLKMFRDALGEEIIFLLPHRTSSDKLFDSIMNRAKLAALEATITILKELTGSRLVLPAIKDFDDMVKLAEIPITQLVKLAKPELIFHRLRLVGIDTSNPSDYPEVDPARRIAYDPDEDLDPDL